ncbi:MAG: class I tRNA ligase family protein, partial [Lachnospiraceae bacterium]|nr:class I tRNA ligase family protein [Lachnospiraceae bacterium]
TLQSEEESIMVSSWPVYEETQAFPEDEEAFAHIQDAIRAIRNSRTELNVPPSKKATVYVVTSDKKIADTFENMKSDYINLAMSDKIIVQADKTGISDTAVSAVIPGAVIYIPLEELVDLDKERERLTKEKDKLMGEIKRAEGMLSNEKFVSKAPEAKVNEEKEKLAKYKDMLEQVELRISQLP